MHYIFIETFLATIFLRNADGWKLSLEVIREFYAENDHVMSGDTAAPATVQAVPRLKGDMFALGKLLEKDEPYKVPVYVRRNGWVGYGIGDAGAEIVTAWRPTKAFP